MKILVTGGAGFIASHIVDAYIERGHKIVIVDDLSSGNKRNLNKAAEFHQLNIRQPEIDALFRRHSFDVVNHHAAQMDVRHSVDEPKFDAEVNIIGTLNLLESCVKHNVRQFIFASTGGAVYGEQTRFPADESHETWPESPYGITKLACEKYLFYYQKAYGLRYAILRYANVYGPRQNPFGEAGVVAIFTNKLLKGEQPVINGDGKQTRDYVFVDDLVRANLQALELKKSTTVNIGTGRETDVNTIFRALNELTGARMAEQHGPAKLGEQSRSCLDFSKAKDELNWQPETELNEGLRQTVNYFQNQ